MRRPVFGRRAATVAGVAASVLLHAAALAVLAPAPTPGGAGGVERPDRVLSVSLLAPPGGPRAGASTAPGQPAADTTSATGGAASMPGERAGSARAVRRVAQPVRAAVPPAGLAMTTTEAAPPPADRATARATEAAAAVAEPFEPSAFREQWDLDEPPQFLDVPARLTELIESSAEPVDARVAVFIDAAGATVRVDVDGMVDAALAADLSDVLQAASFVPGRLAGQTIASIKRFEWRSMTLGVRVVTTGPS